ncbi:MAG: hypothetical protein CBC34_006490 [Hyphomicrobiaceae bacterium TMED74]|nr:hypothetical protein [Filomicrobium sp.]RPG43394.1 MAG: hypothetical protein CBC34_006490 [Hyphomicrobiaceae bacterium TMED74]
MTANSSPRDTVPLHDVSRHQPRQKRVASGCNGHPLRSKGLTFVTHEVEEKKLFGFPGMNALLESAGLRKSKKAD